MAEYSGRVLTLAQAKVLRNRMYLKAVTLNRHIDAAGPEGSIAKYINDHVDKTRHNVKFAKQGNQIFVRAMRDIEPGEELFVDYGRGHWLFCGSAAFLGLNIVEGDERFPSKRVLKAANGFGSHEVICCLSSSAMADVDGLSSAVVYASSVGSDMDRLDANCRLKPSPFVHKTTMVTSLRPISPGEAIIVRAQDRLGVGVSMIGAKGMGAFAREELLPGQILGTLQGNKLVGKTALRVLLEEKPSAAPCIFTLIPLCDNEVLDSFSLEDENDHEDENSPTDDSHGKKQTCFFMDPTDPQGRLKPFETPHVCFIARHPENAAVNCDMQRASPNSDDIFIVVTKRIASGEEAFLPAKTHPCLELQSA